MAAAIEGMTGELDIFEKPVIQTGIIGGNWYQFKPITPVADGNQIFSSGKIYLHLIYKNKSRLEYYFHQIQI